MPLPGWRDATTRSQFELCHAGRSDGVTGDPAGRRSRPRTGASSVPRLFAPATVDYANVDLGFTTGPFDDALVSRLHLVAVTAPGELIVCTSVQGWRFLPGGTREPDESLRELVVRELLEEAGAVPRRRRADHLRRARRRQSGSRAVAATPRFPACAVGLRRLPCGDHRTADLPARRRADRRRADDARRRGGRVSSRPNDR